MGGGGGARSHRSDEYVDMMTKNGRANLGGKFSSPPTIPRCFPYGTYQGDDDLVERKTRRESIPPPPPPPPPVAGSLE